MNVTINDKKVSEYIIISEHLYVSVWKLYLVDSILLCTLTQHIPISSHELPSLPKTNMKN